MRGAICNLEFRDIHPRVRRRALIFTVAGLTFLAAGYIARVSAAVVQSTRHYQASSTVVGVQDITTSNLGNYYVKFDINPEQLTFDDTGVVLTDYALTTLGGLSQVAYSPGDIAQYALNQYLQYMETENPAHRKGFLVQADWLVENQVWDGRQGIWLYNFPLPQYDLEHPWASSLSQGLGISVLLRAYCLTGNEPYFSAAQRAYQSFLIPIEDGGVAWKSSEDLFFEEIPLPYHILNGNIFGLLGLYDYYRVTQSQEAEVLIERNLRTTAIWLPLYDTGYWSNYSLIPRSLFGFEIALASPSYHDLHIDLLRVLGDITGRPLFFEYAITWENYQEEPAAFLVNTLKIVHSDLISVQKTFDRR